MNGGANVGANVGVDAGVDVGANVARPLREAHLSALLQDRIAARRATALVGVWRQRLCLAGHVFRPDGRAAAGGLVRIAPLPRKTGRSTAAGRSAPTGDGLLESRAEAPVFEAAIRADGLYLYFDLPAGDYLCGGHDERGFEIQSRTLKLAARDPVKWPAQLAFDLTLVQTLRAKADDP